MLGFQTIRKVRALYGDRNAAAQIENCSTRLILRCADGDGSSTAAFASSLMGHESYRKAGVNDGDGRGGRSAGTSIAPHTEDAAMTFEIERLVDLAGCLKVPSRPEWHLVKVSYREMPPVAASFVG